MVTSAYYYDIIPKIITKITEPLIQANSVSKGNVITKLPEYIRDDAEREREREKRLVYLTTLVMAKFIQRQW